MQSIPLLAQLRQQNPLEVESRVIDGETSPLKQQRQQWQQVLDEGGTTNAIPMQPPPVPARRSDVPMATDSLESDDDIDTDDEEPV